MSSATKEPAANCIVADLRARVEESISAAWAQTETTQPAGVSDRISVVVVSDSIEDERSSLSSEGRVIEIDIVVGEVRDGAGYESTKRTATTIEAQLLMDGGHREIDGGGHYLVERVDDVVQTADELQSDVAKLISEYSVFYSVPRGDPYTLLP